MNIQFIWLISSFMMFYVSFKTVFHNEKTKENNDLIVFL